MLNKIFELSRNFFFLAVICSLLVSLAMFIYGAIITGQMVLRFFFLRSVEAQEAKNLTVAGIEAIDLFLLATVFYIISIGLYALFIDDNVPMRPWLEIHHFNDLKGKLIGVIIVVLGVLFLGKVVAWEGEKNLLYIGTAVALVIGTLSYYLTVKHK